MDAGCEYEAGLTMALWRAEMLPFLCSCRVNIIYYCENSNLEGRDSQIWLYSVCGRMRKGQKIARCIIFGVLASLLLQKMRSTGVYLIQVQIGTVRSAVIPAGDIFLTLRVGRNSNTTCYSNHSQSSQVTFNSMIQLNVDSSALETQRCSISFNTADRRMIGIALISLPKDKSFLQNTFRLTQNEDRRAEVEAKVRIVPVDVAGRSTLPLQPSDTSIKGQLKQEESLQSSDVVKKIHKNSSKIEANNSLNPENPQSKSKISEEQSYNSSDGRKTPKSFKVVEEDRPVQTTESELRRLKEEKDAYYQLYQIEKGKSEAAGKFIAGLIKKITQAHPSMLSVIASDAKVPKDQMDKKAKAPVQTAQQENTVMSQLEQANRSLHRQVEEYKRMIEQLKGQIVRPKGEIPLQSKASNNFLLPGLFDQPSKSNIGDKSNIKLASTMSLPQEIKQEPSSKKLADVDLQRWLSLSIGQRDQIQTLLSSIQRPSDAPLQNEKVLKRLKTSLDKCFAVLLGKKELTREGVLAFRRQVNRYFEEAVS